jgi:hypothetical protein
MCFVLPKVNYEIYRKKIKRVPVGRGYSEKTLESLVNLSERIKVRELKLLESCIKNRKFEKKFTSREYKSICRKLEFLMDLTKKRLDEITRFNDVFTITDRSEFHFLNYFVGTLNAIKSEVYKNLGTFNIRILDFEKEKLEKINKIRLGLLKIDAIKSILKEKSITDIFN